MLKISLSSKDEKLNSVFPNQDQVSPLQSITSFQLPRYTSTDTSLAFNVLKMDFPNNFGTIRPDYVNPGEERTNYPWVIRSNAGVELLYFFPSLTPDSQMVSHRIPNIPPLSVVHPFPSFLSSLLPFIQHGLLLVAFLGSPVWSGKRCPLQDFMWNCNLSWLPALHLLNSLKSFFLVKLP